MSRLEREEFKAVAEQAKPQSGGRRVMTGTDATQWMAAQGS